MKNTALALIAVAGFAGVANAQALVDVTVNGLKTDVVDVNDSFQFVEVRLQRNGSTAADWANFTAFSQFSGQLATSGGPAAFLLNDPGFGLTDIESDTILGGTVQTSTNDNWLGRRPQSESFFPGGSAGGFRFASETYSQNLTASGSTLSGSSAGGNFDGITNAGVNGGFLTDVSEDLAVFRVFLDLRFIPRNAAGRLEGTDSISISIDFLLNSLGIYVDGAAGTGHNTTRFVTDETAVSGATLIITPAPASAALLGLGGLAATRRRR